MEIRSEKSSVSPHRSPDKNQTVDKNISPRKSRSKHSHNASSAKPPRKSEGISPKGTHKNKSSPKAIKKREINVVNIDTGGEVSHSPRSSKKSMNISKETKTNSKVGNETNINDSENVVQIIEKRKSITKQSSKSLSIENPTCVECYLLGKTEKG